MKYQSQSGEQAGKSTWAGSVIWQARPTNVLLWSVIASASVISHPSYIKVGGMGVARTSNSGDRLSVFSSGDSLWNNDSLLRWSSYQCAQDSTTFCSPSKTQTVFGIHSTPLLDMKVRNIDPKRLASTPKAPMYFDKSCNCGGHRAGYEGRSETRTLIGTSSCGDGRLCISTVVIC